MNTDKTRRINSLVIKEEALIKAFNLNPFLSIPYGIKVLKNECFFNQTALSEVIMADSVCVIEDNAFDGCERLKSILLSPNIERIGRSAFSDCISLRVLTLPVSLTELGFGAFNGCKNLSDVRIFNNLHTVEGAAFVYTRIHSVYFEGSIEDWLNIEFLNSSANPLNKGGKLFIQNQPIKDLTIPAAVEKINNYAFYGCGSLRSLDIKDGVTRIGAYAFAKCSKLKRVYIPKSVESLGRAVFSGCDGMSITLSETLFESIKKKRCPVCQNKLPYYENQCRHCNTEFNIYEV